MTIHRTSVSPPRGKQAGSESHFLRPLVGGVLFVGMGPGSGPQAVDDRSSGFRLGASPYASSSSTSQDRLWAEAVLVGFGLALGLGFLEGMSRPSTGSSQAPSKSVY